MLYYFFRTKLNGATDLSFNRIMQSTHGGDEKFPFLQRKSFVPDVSLPRKENAERPCTCIHRTICTLTNAKPIIIAAQTLKRCSINRKWLSLRISISDWNSALFIILNGTKEEHLDMLDGGIIQRLLEEKWKTFARVSASTWWCSRSFLAEL